MDSCNFSDLMTILIEYFYPHRHSLIFAKEKAEVTNVAEERKTAKEESDTLNIFNTCILEYMSIIF